MTNSILFGKLQEPRLSDHHTVAAEDRVITLNEAAQASCLSIATLRRRLAEGAGPRVVRLSERRIGIRVRDLKAWLDARTSPATKVG
jgi:predicted DNA-binding transcriptional regulator AlpA